jgi:hypothetical protein
MRLLTSLLACASAMVLALLVAWPSLSPQPFPLPGYRNVGAGLALNALAAAAFGFAIWAAGFWGHARSHQWLFTIAAMLCFLFAAIFVSVPVGMGFAVLSMLVRSK